MAGCWITTGADGICRAALTKRQRLFRSVDKTGRLPLPLGLFLAALTYSSANRGMQNRCPLSQLILERSPIKAITQGEKGCPSLTIRMPAKIASTSFAGTWATIVVLRLSVGCGAETLSIIRSEACPKLGHDPHPGPTTSNHQKGGHVCILRMPDHPLHGRGFGALGTITQLVDLWLDERRLPSYMRVVKR